MAGTTYKTGLFRMTSATVREKGGVIVGFAGQTVGVVTAKTVLGVPSGQKVGTVVPHGESLATMAAGTNTSSAFKPYSAGNYAKTNTGEYIMLGQSTKIAGVANNLFRNPAGDAGNRKSINVKAAMDRSYAVTAISYITGALSGSAKTYYWRKMDAALTHPAVAVAQQDHVVVPNITRAIPGEFTISETGKTPTNKDYDAKKS